MNDNVVKFPKLTEEKEHTPWEWLRACADAIEKESTDVAEKKNGTSKTRTIMALAIYDEHGTKAHHRLWRYDGSVIETEGMLVIAARDLADDSAS